MAFAHFAALLVLAPALSAASSLLQQAASRQRTFAGLRYSQQDPAARTLLALDTNHDGRIDPNEVGTFARSQGLDASAATQEFSSIDKNGDGVLDSSELQSVLGSPLVEAPAVQAVAPVSLRSGQAEITTKPVVAEPPLAAAASSEEKAPSPRQPQASKSATYDVEFANQKVIPAKVVPTPEATATRALMAKPAELVSRQSENAKTTEIVSDESRQSIRMAAQQITEELALEEKDEQEARQFDRKAAEVRVNTSSLARVTMQDALDAGAKAAHAKADELMVQISNLEDQAERAEVRAAALRAKSKMEQEEGQKLMAAADQALKQARPSI